MGTGPWEGKKKKDLIGVFCSTLHYKRWKVTGLGSKARSENPWAEKEEEEENDTNSRRLAPATSKGFLQMACGRMKHVLITT